MRRQIPRLMQRFVRQLVQQLRDDCYDTDATSSTTTDATSVTITTTDATSNITFRTTTSLYTINVDNSSQYFDVDSSKTTMRVLRCSRVVAFTCAGRSRDFRRHRAAAACSAYRNVHATRMLGWSKKRYPSFNFAITSVNVHRL